MSKVHSFNAQTFCVHVLKKDLLHSDRGYTKNMTGRGMGFPDTKTRYKKDRKVKHETCVYYISEVSSKGLARCRFCGVRWAK